MSIAEILTILGEQGVIHMARALYERQVSLDPSDEDKDWDDLDDRERELYRLLVVAVFDQAADLLLAKSSRMNTVYENGALPYGRHSASTRAPFSGEKISDVAFAPVTIIK